MKLPDGMVYVFSTNRKGTGINIESRELITCKNCKYYPNNPRPYADDDPIETFIHCQFMEANDFCSKGKAITEEQE